MTPDAKRFFRQGNILLIRHLHSTDHLHPDKASIAFFSDETLPGLVQFCQNKTVTVYAPGGGKLYESADVIHKLLHEVGITTANPSGPTWYRHPETMGSKDNNNILHTFVAGLPHCDDLNHVFIFVCHQSEMSDFCNNQADEPNYGELIGKDIHILGEDVPSQ